MMGTYIEVWKLLRTAGRIRRADTLRAAKVWGALRGRHGGQRYLRSAFSPPAFSSSQPGIFPSITFHVSSQCDASQIRGHVRIPSHSRRIHGYSASEEPPVTWRPYGKTSHFPRRCLGVGVEASFVRITYTALMAMIGMISVSVCVDKRHPHPT